MNFYKWIKWLIITYKGVNVPSIPWSPLFFAPFHSLLFEPLGLWLSTQCCKVFFAVFLKIYIYINGILFFQLFNPWAWNFYFFSYLSIHFFPSLVSTVYYGVSAMILIVVLPDIIRDSSAAFNIFFWQRLFIFNRSFFVDVNGLFSSYGELQSLFHAAHGLIAGLLSLQSTGSRLHRCPWLWGKCLVVPAARGISPRPGINPVNPALADDS